LNETLGFDLTEKEGGTGPSDHSSFYARKIPVMHYFTGLHSDYHRPSDDFDKINVAGMRRVAEIVAGTAVAIAEADARPTYVETKSTERSGGDGDRPYFGSIPDFGQEQPGYAISGATKDSPADKAGLKGGDIIIKLGDSKIGNLEDFDNALRKFKGGDKVPVVVKRGSEEVRSEVTLSPPR
jgi:C-terminal processing protease CtpA/Prc